MDENTHPYGPGSHAPFTDPHQMPTCYPIKGNNGSMKYHRPDSTGYGDTKAEVWFDSPSAAEAAGFSLAGSHPDGAVAGDFEPGGSQHPCDAAAVDANRRAAMAFGTGATGAGEITVDGDSTIDKSTLAGGAVAGGAAAAAGAAAAGFSLSGDDDAAGAASGSMEDATVEMSMDDVDMDVEGKGGKGIGLGGAAAAGAAGVAGAAGLAAAGGKDALGKVGDVASGATGKVGDVASGATGKVGDVASGASGKVGDVSASATGRFKGLGDDASGKVTGAAAGASAGVAGAASSTRETVTTSRGRAAGTAGGTATITRDEEAERDRGGFPWWWILLGILGILIIGCLLYTSPSPRDRQKSRMPSSA